MKSLKLSRWLPSGRTTVIGMPFLFLLVFFLLPFLLVVGISFSQQQLG
ncbi:putrescine ABC transporter permease PotH, partial [Pseudomonas sp. MWU13-2860]